MDALRGGRARAIPPLPDESAESHFLSHAVPACLKFSVPVPSRYFSRVALPVPYRALSCFSPSRPVLRQDVSASSLRTSRCVATVLSRRSRRKKMDSCASWISVRCDTFTLTGPAENPTMCQMGRYFERQSGHLSISL